VLKQIFCIAKNSSYAALVLWQMYEKVNLSEQQEVYNWRLSMTNDNELETEERESIDKKKDSQLAVAPRARNRTVMLTPEMTGQVRARLALGETLSKGSPFLPRGDADEGFEIPKGLGTVSSTVKQEPHHAVKEIDFLPHGDPEGGVSPSESSEWNTVHTIDSFSATKGHDAFNNNSNMSEQETSGVYAAIARNAHKGSDSTVVPPGAALFGTTPHQDAPLGRGNVELNVHTNEAHSGAQFVPARGISGAGNYGSSRDGQFKNEYAHQAYGARTPHYNEQNGFERPGNTGQNGGHVTYSSNESNEIGGKYAGHPSSISHVPNQKYVQESLIPISTTEKKFAHWVKMSPVIGFLVSFDTDVNGDIYVLRSGRVVVTSDSSISGQNYILVDDESVSPCHAFLRVSPSGEIQVLDQLSECGTKIIRFGSKEEIELSGEKSTLEHGDVIKFGNRTFYVSLLAMSEVE
jgi:hypothetical protein